MNLQNNGRKMEAKETSEVNLCGQNSRIHIHELLRSRYARLKLDQASTAKTEESNMRKIDPVDESDKVC